MNSGKMTTIARPYVAAAFEYALAHKKLAAWETFLRNASLITQNSQVAGLLTNPEVDNDKIADLYLSILGDVDEHQKNFLRLLAQNERLMVLPDIYELYKKQYAAHEKIIEVEVTSAYPLEEAYQQKLRNVLAKRLQRDVKLEMRIDPTLLGGVMVRAGDMVIDGTIRGKLTRLNEFI